MVPWYTTSTSIHEPLEEFSTKFEAITNNSCNTPEGFKCVGVILIAMNEPISDCTADCPN